ncbi:MAG: T9SS type A sorting domain-containing protein [Candidatus Poribacteria bacterium]|nr:T9SS type A sorting domain-containing protein [Candidatus Poribacteria bacterium]
MDADGTQKDELADGNHRFRLTYRGATRTIQQVVAGTATVLFQTVSATIALNDSAGTPIAASAATVEVQPGSSGGYLPFGADGILDAAGIESMELLPGNHRYRVVYRGATQTIQTDTALATFQTRLVSLRLNDSAGSLIADSDATVEVQPGSSGGYLPLGADGILDATGTESMELLPGNHRYRLGWRGATQTIQSADTPILFQTKLFTVELKDSFAALIADSDATVEVQPASSGSYLAFGDGGVLDPTGSETMELLSGNHRFRLTYRGANQTIQSSATPVGFQTVAVFIELRDEVGALVLDSGATVEVQPDSSGAYIPFGDDGVLDPTGTESMELLPKTHRFRLTHNAITQTQQSAEPLVVFDAQLFAAPTRLQTQLGQNFPNPFNPETWIPFRLAQESQVRIIVYDANGERVRQLNLGVRHAGNYFTRSNAAYWDGRNEIGENVASGIYYYQIQTDSFSFMKRMVLLK